MLSNYCPKPVVQYAMPAIGRFGKYKKEGEQAIRVPELVEGDGFRRLVTLWNDLGFEPDGGGQDHWNRGSFIHAHYRTMRAASHLEYSAADVATFSTSILRFALDENQRLAASAFLTAIIAAGKEISYSLFLNHADGDFPFLGFENTKDVTIIGDLDGIGEGMKGGTISVHGWGGHVGQNMEGGLIVIEGDCDGVGSQMKGGEIIVRGSVRRGHKTSGSYCGIGFDTSGGKITIEGNCEECQNVSGGDISIGGDVIDAGMRNNGAIIRIGGSVTGQIGPWMWDGEIYIGGDMPKTIKEFGGGRIYHKGKLVVDFPHSYPGYANKTIELP